jgi:hypothetical protein
MVPGGSGGATIGTTIFTCVYIEKSTSPEPSGQFQSNFVQIILGQREFQIVQIKGQVIFKGEIIMKMQKFGEVIENFSLTTTES